MRWNGEGRREATVELAVLAARGLAADGLEQVALGVALRLAGVHARVEVAPVTALEGSCAAALTAWANMSTFRIHLSSLLSWARAMARCCESLRLAGDGTGFTIQADAPAARVVGFASFGRSRRSWWAT